MKTIGKYQIIDLLGKGAMGVVYKALDPDIDRQVAIKTIRFDLISEESEKNDLMLRFVREARAAGKLVHPNIITIYEVGKEEDLTYIVMQYIEGKSLQNLIVSGKKFSNRDIVHLMTQLCDALEYAHQHGIVHRDIKPANILLDKTGKPYVVDFGVARVEMSTITQTGATIGTPSYMSPEQVMGEKIDKRSDIFSLGAILYELITGRRPFEGESITTVIYKIINEEVPSASKARKGFSEEFEAIIDKALAKSADQRYQSCEDLAGDLKKIVLKPDETMTISGQKDLYPAKETESAEKKRILLPLFIAGAVIAIGAAGFLLYQKFWSKSAPVAADQGIQLKTALPPPRAMLSVLETFETEMDRLKRSYERGDYSEVVSRAQVLLKKEESNQAVRELLTQAREKLKANSAAQYLASGKQNYENGKYGPCLKDMEKVLGMDRDNEEAQRYHTLADKALSKIQIRQVVERQRLAEEQKDLLAFLSDIAPEALKAEKKNDATFLFNNFDEIKSHISNLSIEFGDSDHADVGFSHMLVAVDKRTKKKRVLFEGKKTLKMLRQKKTWKIMGYD